MLHIVLFEPEIPPNTGNIIRLCSNTGSTLHLIHPLGFELSDRKLRRAGLDYHEFSEVKEYPSLQQFIERADYNRLYACSTRGKVNYCDAEYEEGDALLFGPETRGLPQAVIDSLAEANRIRIPMRPDNRSLNLSNSVSIILYEAWRQLGFNGAS
ncbi:MAG: tRNA (uridine(34)/cytosine(34)/5-carboxymethylaminomethyluridine(34)-2'-O)-methyltransferase TrmL [Candidatus Polarisedimenticolaceae bacterium]|nr:tRNA (uridine(34)/cytosine(34)/5-carboxymethylaminomethyluridine(34)-2'-O)-methyltransferase TrmL [Candidatus Polarisedimenticolaceae bacterium]